MREGPIVVGSTVGGVELDRLGVVDDGVLEAAQLAEGEAPAQAARKAFLVQISR
jgi:hypothetical protein